MKNAVQCFAHWLASQFIDAFVYRYDMPSSLNVPRKMSPQELDPGMVEAKLVVHPVRSNVSLVLDERTLV